MADPIPVRTPRAAQPAADETPPRRIQRPDPEFRAAQAALIAEAERIMGVSPIRGLTGPRPGY